MLKAQLGIHQKNADDFAAHPLFVGGWSNPLSTTLDQNSSHGHPYATLRGVDAHNHSRANPALDVPLDIVAPNVDFVAFRERLSWFQP
eukprot:1853136-Karenia_brevis.AAC.1